MSLLFSKDATIGAIFVGFAASSALFGVLCSQTWSYMNRYPLDRTAYKLLVALVWLIELVDQAFIGHACYYYSVSGWGNPLVFLKKPVWSLILQVTLGAFDGAIMFRHAGVPMYDFNAVLWYFLFMTYDGAIVSQRNIPVTVLIIALAIAQLAFACIYTAKA
ncbi:hypothetical protein EUX98_g5067 [Antrodiella citrinella]|uniref:Uncharacterized protein n=1 Tax=Antrodiella citrinella TaxID=2447956 RepID=A0A4S4MSG1_9APHY|nr:hypothetical protein EUX98_g5067 [Antrodiella citrinella]